MANLYRVYDSVSNLWKFLKEIGFKSIGFGDSLVKVIEYSGSCSDPSQYILNKDGAEFTLPNNSGFFFKIDWSIISTSTGQTRSDEHIGYIKRYSGVTTIINIGHGINHAEGSLASVMGVDVDNGVDGELRLRVDMSVIETFKVTALITGQLVTI